ncbi:hypothetical protein [Wenyingzhuangia sp. IMCC45574]
MNFKKVCFYVLTTVAFIGCEPDSGLNYNHQGKYDTEKGVVEEFLKSHTYDAETGELVDLEAGDVSLFDDTANLEKHEKTFNDVDYTMYSYITNQGVGNNPDDNDIINVEYRVHRLSKNSETGELEESDTIDERYVSDNFFDLASTNLYVGWKLGFQSFKEGTVDESSPELPRQFSNEGRGFIILPSGLTHAVEGRPVDDSNTILIFKVALRTVTQVANE